ncbi:MAG: hypothetical protein ACI8S6_003296 [Myxococcota bacterium]|jgi:hypothetical protein
MPQGSESGFSNVLGILGAAVVSLTLLYGLYRTRRDQQRLLAAMAERGFQVLDALPSLLAIGLGAHILGFCMGWLEPLGNVGLWPAPLQWSFGFWFVIAGALAYPHTVARNHEIRSHNVR